MRKLFVALMLMLVSVAAQAQTTPTFKGLNINPPPNTLNNVLRLNMTPSGNLSGGGPQFMKFMINRGDINTGLGGGNFAFIEPFVIEHHHGGANWSGGVNSFSVYSYHDQATNPQSNNNNYVAGTFTQEAVTTDGGNSSTSAVYGGATGLIWQSGAKGAFFGINTQAGLQEDATNIFNLTGAEINVYSHNAIALLSTTAGSTTATYSSLGGKIGYGQVVFADLTQVPFGTTLVSVTPGSNGSGSVVLSAPAGKTSTQAIQLRPSVYYKSGIQITNRGDDVVAGSVVDAMISLSGQGPAKWRNAILLGDQNGAYPLDPAATVIGTKGAGTVANVMDFSGYTVTGSLVKGQKTNLTEGILALTGLNSSIELGSSSQSGLGILDGHSSGFNNDYDARVLFYGGTSTNGTGKISLIGAGVVIPFGTPASATAPCDQGQITFDATYIYTCVATNSWHRASNGAAW